MKKYLKLIRVSNWLKNFLVLAPLVFSLKLFEMQAMQSATAAFLAFCFAASSLYIINDLFDLEADKLHPRKKLRPLPSGQIAVQLAICIAGLLFIAGCLLCLLLPVKFAGIIAGYLIFNIFYTFVLKKINLVESISIGISFVLRVAGGCAAIVVKPSPWILTITFFLALFLTFIKRKSELIMLSQSAVQHRKVLAYYNTTLLDKYIHICATVVLTGYLLYTIDDKVIAIFHTDKLVYSTLFVVLGIFRFMQLGENDEYQGEGDPTTLLIKDKFLQITVILWIIYMICTIYFPVLISFFVK